jgi:hypothetical protein
VLREQRVRPVGLPSPAGRWARCGSPARPAHTGERRDQYRHIPRRDQATATDRLPAAEREFGDRLPKRVSSAIPDRSEVTVTVSVNEQVAGHKVTVGPAAPAERGQRRASCECGWKSRIGTTEQVMPELRTHLDAALRST